ncbi:MAG: sulfatase-like hydrolase/transferase, partial [Planctomycetota bacterium]
MKNRMARRRFLKTTTAVAATSIFYPFSKTRAANKSTKPDILMIMPDQMRGDCLSILGHSALTTPNLDKLTAKGVLFRRAYTTVASCIPARYALLTGLYPQTSGVVGFRAKKFSTATLPHLLTINDYSTILVGRNMHQPAASGACGYQKRIHGSTYVANDEYDKFLKKSAPDTGGIRKLVSDIGVTYN